MSKELNLKDDFKFVSYKNKGRKQRNQTTPHPKKIEEEESFDFAAAKRRIFEAKQDLQDSDLYSSILASLREGLGYLGNREIKEIICFGLGKFSECVISRYQLSLLLCFKDVYKSKVFVYDPAFNDNEIGLLKDLELEVLNENNEGKYKVQKGKLSLFYLPHCPKQLTNNLLWCNWGLNLSDCIIISNSFTKILEDNTKRDLQINANFVCSIFPHTLELAVINSFRYFDIFNDTAIHVFPPDKLALISEEFWTFCQEPKYSTNDLEFITAKLDSLKTG